MVLPLPLANVTATFAPVSLPQALAQLSAATGERWTCAPALRDEVLFARLKDASPERVKRTVGEIFDAEWVAQNGEFRLVPDPAAAHGRAQRNEAARAERIAAGLTQLRADLAKLPPHFTEADAKAYRAQGKEWEKRVETWSKGSMNTMPPEDGRSSHAAPLWRATAAVALAIPTRDYLGLRLGERVVYGDRPTSLQRPLPAAATLALAQYRREVPPFLEEGVPFRVRLVVTRQAGAEGGIDAEFQSLDAEGDEIENETVSIDTRADAPEPATGGHPILLDSEAVEHAKLTSDDEETRMVRDTRFAKWSDLLQDPVRNEPLQWGAGAAVLACTKVSDQPVLGTVTDAMATPGPDVKSGFLPENYLDLLAPFWRREDGWIVFDPPERLPRVSRSLARDAIRRAVQAGGVSLDDAAAWTASLPPDAEDWTTDTIRLLANAEAIPGFPESLRLWAALGTEVRAELRAGRPVPFSALPRSCREALARALVSSDGPELNVEPTELFAEGAPDAVLSLQTRPMPMITAWSASVGEDSWRWPFAAGPLGTMVGRQEALGKGTEVDRFRLVEGRSLTLTIGVGPNDDHAIRYKEVLLPPGSPVLTSLPDDVAKAFEAGRVRGRTAPTPRVKP